MEQPTRATVCLDPGHPSETSAGASGPGGLREAHLNWLVAVALREILEREGIRVVMTKSSEAEHVTNRRRAEIANDAHACLFLRLHCDDRARPGTATYYPDRAGHSQGCTGPDEQVRVRSREAAQALHPAMMAALGANGHDLGIHGETATAVGAKQGALTGSVFSKVPAVTVEMIAVTNRSDAAWLSSAEGPRRMAEALAQGVLAWVE